jgi:hypothetical protein
MVPGNVTRRTGYFDECSLAVLKAGVIELPK